MKKKTEIITLGVQNTNPGTPKETTEVRCSEHGIGKIATESCKH